MYKTPPRNDDRLTPPVWILCLWPCYSWDSQPATCWISPLINCRTDCFDTPPTPISLPPTIPDSIGSPERNQKEGEVQETWALLTLCWQKARTVLFTLTRELNKIMSMVIPVAGENLDPGQARHAHLPGMHKPIRRERKWASGLHDFSFYSFSEHTASPL